MFPDLQLILRRKRQLRMLIAALLLVGLAAYFLSRPTRNAIKGWQARRHAQAAFGFIEQSKWADARNEAVAAYQLRPTEPQALRAVARFLSRSRQQQAFDFWEQLAKVQPLTRDDLRDEASVALVTGETARGVAAIDRLLAGDGKDATPQDWLLAAQLRLLQNAPAKALEALEKIFANAAATPREQLQATLLELQAAHTGASPNEEKDAEAWQRLDQLGQREDAVGLDALVLLAQRQLAAGNKTGPGSPKPVDLIARLQNHPLSKHPQKLLAVDLQIQAEPEKKEALIDRAIAQWKGGDFSQQATLATWLNGKGEHQRVLDAIPLERAVQSRDTFLQHMDALGALGRWEEIKPLLDNERYPLDPVLQRMYLARCNMQLHQEAAANNNWQRALEASAGDPDKLGTLADYAEKNGAAAIADAAYAQALQVAPGLRNAWQGRLRLAYADRDTQRVHAILAHMLPLWPNDPAVQSDEAYLRLLLLPNPGGSEQRTAIEKLAADLVEKHPTSLPHRTLLALALLKQDRPVAALQVYDGIQAAANALTPSALAVHAAVLAANGQTETAREEIRHVPPEKLLPEEQALTAALR